MRAGTEAVLGVITVASVLAAGCSPRAGSPLHADTAHWKIAFAVTPEQPRQLDPAQFKVQVTDKNKTPVSGAAVTVGLAMPAMDMGRNDVRLHEAPPGTYTGTGRFTMPGDWEAAVSADKGAAHQSQTFPVSVR
jgi:nitrogen fixation protein FixH